MLLTASIPKESFPAALCPGLLGSTHDFNESFHQQVGDLNCCHTAESTEDVRKKLMLNAQNRVYSLCSQTMKGNTSTYGPNFKLKERLRFCLLLPKKQFRKPLPLGDVFYKIK